jgi:hypothetical protein
MKKTEIGGVYGFTTKDVINHEELFKWHICDCNKTHQYLFVCRQCYPGDFPIPNGECEGLPLDLSYISLGRALFRPKIPNNAKVACVLSADFLRALYGHVEISDEMAPVDKRKILPGIARRLTEKYSC